jgi:hypothetical protein
MADFNANSPTLRGMELRPKSSRTKILNSTGKGIAMRFKGFAGTVTSLHRYLTAVSGTPGLGLEVLSSLNPTVATSTFAPNLDDSFVGSVFKQPGASQTSMFQAIDEAVLDTTDYIEMTGTNPKYLFEINTSGGLAGKRVDALVLTLQCHSPISGGYLFVGLNQGGTYRQKFVTGVPFVLGSLYQFTIRWDVNPQTGKPWTIAEVEAFDGADEIEIRWVGFTGYGRLWLYQAVVTVEQVTENRLGFIYSLGKPVVGWNEENTTDATLSASTHYYSHMFGLEANSLSTLQVPVLKDPEVIKALTASATTGEHREAYETTRTPGGLIKSAVTLPTEVMPLLIDTGSIATQSQPYAELDDVSFYTATPDNSGTEITAAGATAYGGIRVPVGWAQAQRPDAPIKFEIRSTAAALTGDGTLHATATLNPEDSPSRDYTDLLIPFDAPFTSSAIQYYVYIEAFASATRAWKLGRLDSRSDVVTGTTAAEVQGATQGGTADSWFTTAIELDRYDMPIALVASPTAPAGVTATPAVGA